MLDRPDTIDGVVLPRVRKHAGGRRRHAEIDEARFRQLWAEGVSVRDIAAEFQLGRSQISRIAGDLALPDRAPKPARSASKPKGRSKPDMSPEDAQHLRERLAKAYRAEALPLRGGWTRGRDLAVAEAAGAYEAMAVLAKRWGISMQHVIARWHRMRAWVI